eukprot:TRINITY_DN460_c0_g1_i3.p1 TRINITY_DN460_c0_g1~~TRINITY_DN460_c0_g1_i3.p1  ORF type:complete len:212 (-),score=16.48 TRINITY_DN460_c0_g1_i3:390-1025(-)
MSALYLLVPFIGVLAKATGAFQLPWLPVIPCYCDEEPGYYAIGFGIGAGLWRHTIGDYTCDCDHDQEPEPPSPATRNSCYCNGEPSYPAYTSRYTKSQLLDLSDEELFNVGLEGVNNCRINVRPNAGACYYYVSSGGSFGYPLTPDCRGTGCVKAPDEPKSVNTCYYQDRVYGSAINEVASKFCTSNGVSNAAAQLRHAIENDACNCSPPL